MKRKRKGYTLYWDAETYDPELEERGSCYIWNPSFRLLFITYRMNRDGETKFEDDPDKIRKILNNAHTFVCHNLAYELGICHYLGVNYKYKTVRCTMIGSKLSYNLRNSHSLEYLGRKILGKEKDQQRFGRLMANYTFPDGSMFIEPSQKYVKEKAVIEAHRDRCLEWQEKMVKKTLRRNNADRKKGVKEEDLESLEDVIELTLEESRAYITKTNEKRVKEATKKAMGNLDLVYDIDPDLVIEYGISDVDLTVGLDDHWLTKISRELYEKFSDAVKVCAEIRHQGCPIDVKACEVARDYLAAREVEVEVEMKERGWWVNWKSWQKVAELMIKNGVPLKKHKVTGNYMTGKDEIKDIDHPLVHMLMRWRKYHYAKENVLKWIMYTEKGRLHGSMYVLGAQNTGRFSHKLPNLGNVPVRDKEFGHMLRACFTCEPDQPTHQWQHLDFSAQEPRLYVHWGVRCQIKKPKYKEQYWCRTQKKFVFSDKFVRFDCPEVLTMQQAYIDDPALDSHVFSLNLVEASIGKKISNKSDKDRRTEIKETALGEAYGKGTEKHAKLLNISEEAARALKKAYNTALPYIKKVSDFSQYQFRFKGFVRTIGGRKNYYNGAAFKAFNYRIQGSAADQTLEAMLWIYYILDIVPLVVVHDEINFSGTVEDAKRVKFIMEHATVLEVPSLSEICTGDNWASAKG